MHKRFVKLSLIFVPVILAAVFVFAKGLTALELSVDQDTLIKTVGSSAIYYYAADGNRYLFPNEKVYKSWFGDFSQVKTVGDLAMMTIPLRGMVTYRPGVKMIKAPTANEVYAIAKGGVRRPLANEEIAKFFYGDNWNEDIDDIAEIFLDTYPIGVVSASSTDYDLKKVLSEAVTINRNMGIAETDHAPRATTGGISEESKAAETKETATSTLPASPTASSTPESATSTSAAPQPSVPAYAGGNSNLGVPPIITDLGYSATDSSATITLYTDRAATCGAVLNSLTFTGSSGITYHSINVTGLLPATTYYYTLNCASVDGVLSSLSRSFTTDATVATAQIIYIDSFSDDTNATIEWRTDVATSGRVRYSASSPVDTSSHTDIYSSISDNMIHWVHIPNLTASTTYYYIVINTDSAGNTVASYEKSFTTKIYGQ
jgi:hypothetical protein